MHFRRTKSISTEKLLGQPDIKLYGGYVAESLKYQDASTGSSNDIERATDIAAGWCASGG
jgi:ATP-dependent Zn protease